MCSLCQDLIEVRDFGPMVKTKGIKQLLITKYKAKGGNKSSAKSKVQRRQEKLTAH